MSPTTPQAVSVPRASQRQSGHSYSACKKPYIRPHSHPSRRIAGSPAPPRPAPEFQRVEIGCPERRRTPWKSKTPVARHSGGASGSGELWRRYHLWPCCSTRRSSAPCPRQGSKPTETVPCRMSTLGTSTDGTLNSRPQPCRWLLIWKYHFEIRCMSG